MEVELLARGPLGTAGLETEYSSVRGLITLGSSKVNSRSRKGMGQVLTRWRGQAGQVHQFPTAQGLQDRVKALEKE